MPYIHTILKFPSVAIWLVVLPGLSMFSPKIDFTDCYWFQSDCLYQKALRKNFYYNVSKTLNYQKYTNNLNALIDNILPFKMNFQITQKEKFQISAFSFLNKIKKNFMLPFQDYNFQVQVFACYPLESYFFRWWSMRVVSFSNNLYHQLYNFLVLVSEKKR